MSNIYHYGHRSRHRNSGTYIFPLVLEGIPSFLYLEYIQDWQPCSCQIFRDILYRFFVNAYKESLYTHSNNQFPFSLASYNSLSGRNFYRLVCIRCIAFFSLHQSWYSQRNQRKYHNLFRRGQSILGSLGKSTP